MRGCVVVCRLEYAVSVQSTWGARETDYNITTCMATEMDNNVFKSCALTWLKRRKRSLGGTPIGSCGCLRFPWKFYFSILLRVPPFFSLVEFSFAWSVHRRGIGSSWTKGLAEDWQNLESLGCEENGQRSQFGRRVFTESAKRYSWSLSERG